MALAVVLATIVACSQGQEAANRSQQDASNAQTEQKKSSNAYSQPRDEREEKPGKKQSSDVIRVNVSGGDARASVDPADVALGDKVTIAVTSDASDEIHVHGYNKFKEVEAGQTATISFVANIPGAFEVELEESGLALLELRVQ